MNGRTTDGRGALRALAVGLALAGGAAPAAAAQYTFLRADMDGAQADPPNGSTATGRGLFVMDRAANTLAMQVTWAGEGGPMTAGHIHGWVPPGQTAGVQFAISPPGPNESPYVNVWSYPPDDEDELLAELGYVNVHSTAVPTGEIRGQILRHPDLAGALAATLDGGQTLPPSGSPATGRALVTVDVVDNVLGYVIDVDLAALEGAELSAALRGWAGPGAAGPVLHDLPLGAAKLGTWTYPEEQEAALLAGLAYVEVTTAAHPAGELRGQLVPLPRWAWVVDAAGGGDFAELQAAVDAADEGDTLLVKSGSYAPFAVVGKSLCVTADAGAQVLVQGAVEVRDLAGTQSVTLAGLELAGSAGLRGGAALVAAGCVGALRVQGATLRGADGAGAEAARLEGCLDAAFVGCTLVGGAGQAADAAPCPPAAAGGDGGPGLRTLQSAFALYGSTLTGGPGGDGCSAGGRGGAACAVTGFGAFLSGGALQGGDGGASTAPGSAAPGDGGDGLHVDAGAQARFQDVALSGGAGGGSPSGASGLPGAGTGGGGVFLPLPGAAHALSVPAPAREGDALALTVSGPPGDRVHLFVSTRARFEYVPSVDGALLVARPLRPALLPLCGFPAPGAAGIGPAALPLGEIPAGGVLSVALPLAELLPGMRVDGFFLQAVAERDGAAVGLSGAARVTLLDATL